jgi:hypothetical protein
MTHALPGDDGHHHVNNQPQEYWVRKLNAVGYDVDPHNTVYVSVSERDQMKSYFSQSGLIFHRIIE